MTRRSVHPSTCRCAVCTGPRNGTASFVLHRDPARRIRDRLAIAATGLAIVAAFLAWQVL